MPCPKFPSYACSGDTVRWREDGFDMSARVEYDADTSPYDYSQPGWCFDITDPVYGEQNRKYIRAWENDEWFYGTVIVTASRAGIVLGADSVSGIDVNFPSDCENPNWYLSEVADTIAAVARDVARGTLHTLGVPEKAL